LRRPSGLAMTEERRFIQGGSAAAGRWNSQ
jgi:hypothetical protein